MRIPTATYRLQLNAGTGFAVVRELLDYLEDLGISDIYASPVFAARRESAHGYDITDMNRFNPVLGGESGFSALIAAVRERGLGWIQDIVPNHMAWDFENEPLSDLLRSGPESPYYDFFDIDWNHPAPNLHGKAMAPFLGGHYAEVLENGEISLELEPDGFVARYYDQRFPIARETEAALIDEILDALAEIAPDRMTDIGREIRAVLEFFQRRPGERMAVFRQFTQILIREEVARRAAAHVLKSYRCGIDFPEATTRFDRLLSRQFYSLTYWRSASEQINYRRFFDINHLITLRMHDPSVFEKSHRLILEKCRNGDFTGLRIDHVDGLRDPKAYLERLRDQVPGTYLLVEKILAEDEPLPEAWPMQGTTGYEFGVMLGGLFCKPESAPAFSDLYARFTGVRKSFDQFVNDGKRRCMAAQFSGDLDNIVGRLCRIAANHRHGKDIPPARLRIALAELLASFSVYRTYVDASGRSNFDERMFNAAIAVARVSREDLAYEFDFLERIWTLDFDPELFEGEDERRLWLDWIMDCQQHTAPLTAKGLEDTALYNFNRFVAANEVGGAPDRFGLTIEQFHAFCRERLDRMPDTMNATATHDSKRGEDVRARLWVLTEIPDEWERVVFEWQRENEWLKPVVRGRRVPEPNFEYLLYQMILGAFPFDIEERTGFLERMQEYAVKAAREAKAETDWRNPNVEYEAGCREFLARLLGDGQHSPLIEGQRPPLSPPEGGFPSDPPPIIADSGHESPENDRKSDSILREDDRSHSHPGEFLHANSQDRNLNYPLEEDYHSNAAIEEGHSSNSPLEGRGGVGRGSLFLPNFLPFFERIAHYGIFNSLSQALIKITAPGIPDIYQGTEWFNFSMVDPDNRRPVDYGRRRKALSEMMEAARRDRRALIDDLLRTRTDGRIKMYLTATALAARRNHPELFRRGDYIPLETTGRWSDHLIAFARRLSPAWAIIAVPRFLTDIIKPGEDPLGRIVWEDTAVVLPGGAPKVWRNDFTGEMITFATGRIEAAALLARFPAALMTGEDV